MGTIRKGILGGFSGKVGTVVGAAGRFLTISWDDNSGVNSAKDTDIVPKVPSETEFTNH